MGKKKLSNVHKATAAGTVAGALATYSAGWLSAKFGLPLELTAPVAGGVLGYVTRLAAKMLPDA